MNRTQDTIILEKIFNERLELSIYKNRGQFYLTKNLRKQFRHKIEINIDVKNQKRLIIKELDEGNVQQNFYSKKLAQHISDLVGVHGNMKFLFIRDEADNCWIGVLLPEMAGSYLWDINMCQKKEYLPKDYKEEIIISIYRKFWNLLEKEEMLCSTLSYPKEYRPFEEVVEAPKKFLEVKQAYFNSMQNFLRQVAGLIQRDENDVRLALYNLKQAKAGLPKMHKFFDGMELDEEIASKHTNLCRQESQKILEIYMCCQYFLQHDASPTFDKYQIRNWYRDVCTKEIEDVNVALDAMQQEYDAVFPDQAYEEAVFKHYPIILRSFDMTREEVIQDFMLRTIAFAETSFDYMLVLQCDENGDILQHAIKFPKRFFKAIEEALVSGEEITDTSLLTPYPIDVTENMLECFSGDWKIKRQTDNPYVHYLGDIAEELWVYSKLRELLCKEEDREYCRCELKKVAEKIAIMKKEIHLHLDEEVANQIDEMCNHVYEGNCFDNIRLNEFVQNLQYILV